MVLCAAVALVASFSVPATAAEWSFFGDVKFRTFWTDDDKETGNIIPALHGYGGDRGQNDILFDDSDLLWGKSVGCAFGGSVQAGDVGGFVAIRPLENSIHVYSGDFFQFYGTWNFGAGTLLVGKTFGPVNWFGSNMVFLDENCCLGFGGILSYVKSMIQVSFEGDWGILKIAALEPETGSEVYPIGGIPHFQQNVSSGVLFNTFAEEDTTLPKLEASYANTWGPLEVTLMGGWQEWEGVAQVGNTEREHDVESWILGLGLKLNMGPFYVNGDIFTGENLGQYQFTFQLGADDAVYDAVNDTIHDNETIGAMIAAGYKVNDMISLEAGFGWNEHEVNWLPTLEQEDETMGYYLQAVITMAPGVTITPEIGKLDWKDIDWSGDVNQSIDQGDTIWVGAQWRITF
jgi:hypothetical protein